jgi:hypothetical protein
LKAVRFILTGNDSVEIVSHKVSKNVHLEDGIASLPSGRQGFARNHDVLNLDSVEKLGLPFL